MLEQEGLNCWGVWNFSQWNDLAGHLKKGFAYAKQRCTAYPRYVVQRRLLPEFLEMYYPVVAALKFGHPCAESASCSRRGSWACEVDGLLALGASGCCVIGVRSDIGLVILRRRNGTRGAA